MADRNFEDRIKQAAVWNSSLVQEEVEDALDPLTGVLCKVAQDGGLKRVEIRGDVGSHRFFAVGREGLGDRSQDPLVVIDARPVLAGASDVERRNKAAQSISRCRAPGFDPELLGAVGHGYGLIPPTEE